MSVKVEATLELLTLAHEVVLLRKERAEATVLMEQAADDLEKLKAALPDGMEHCKIVFEECPVGHGHLRGDNWLKKDCQRCKVLELEAENERLKAVNALMEYAAFPSAEDAKDAETWIAANPGRPLSDYCPPGGLLVKRLTAEVERLNSELLQRDMTWLPAKDAENERLRAALEEVRDSGLLWGPTVLHDKTLETVHAALKEPRT